MFNHVYSDLLLVCSGRSLTPDPAITLQLQHCVGRGRHRNSKVVLELNFDSDPLRLSLYV